MPLNLIVSGEVCTTTVEEDYYGMSAAGLRHFWNQNRSAETEGYTTSDVCHTLIKPATVARGWECLPKLTNPVERYYDHLYRNIATGETICCGFGKAGTPPNGSQPYCEVR